LNLFFNDEVLCRFVPTMRFSSRRSAGLFSASVRPLGVSERLSAPPPPIQRAEEDRSLRLSMIRKFFSLCNGGRSIRALLPPPYSDTSTKANGPPFPVLPDFHERAFVPFCEVFRSPVREIVRGRSQPQDPERTELGDEKRRFLPLDDLFFFFLCGISFSPLECPLESSTRPGRFLPDK